MTKATDATQAPTRPKPNMPDLVWVTPAVATAWLDLNTGNRKLREPRAQAFSRDMTNGDWYEDVVAGIHFVNEDGLLGDGQHRLRAVEISGQPQWFFVQHLPRIAIAVAVDKGAKRNVMDSLHFEGITTNYVQAAIARKVLLLEAGYAPGAGGIWKPTEAEIHDLLIDPIKGKLVVEADKVASLIRRSKGLNARASVVGTAYFQTHLINPQGAEEFFVTQLANSEGLIKESPANALRRRLASQSGKNMSETQQYNMIIHAWNHYRENNILERLSAPKSWGPNGYAVAI